MNFVGMASYLSTLYTEPVIYFVFIWTLFWKGFGLWYAGKNKQKYWFIAMFLLNTVGILPIIYLFIFSKTPMGKQCRKIFSKAAKKKGKKRARKTSRKKKR